MGNLDFGSWKWKVKRWESHVRVENKLSREWKWEFGREVISEIPIKLLCNGDYMCDYYDWIDANFIRLLSRAQRWLLRRLGERPIFWRTRFSLGDASNQIAIVVIHAKGGRRTHARCETECGPALAIGALSMFRSERKWAQLNLIRWLRMVRIACDAKNRMEQTAEARREQEFKLIPKSACCLSSVRACALHLYIIIIKIICTRCSTTHSAIRTTHTVRYLLDETCIARKIVNRQSENH